MSKKKEKQQETVSYSDTAMAFADRIAPFMGLLGSIDSLNSGSVTLGVSPMKYLLKLLQHVNVTRSEIEDFIANIIIAGIPPLELAVKASILTNLKKMVSCSVDPRIPYKYRKRHKSNSTGNEHGIDIDLEAIDIFDKLSVDPLSEEGQNLYFGNKDAETVYEFVRAEDFDAFLWFAMHKGKFPFPGTISNAYALDLTDADHGYGSGWSIESSGSSLYTMHLNLTLNRTNDGNPSSCIPGNTFTYGPFPIEGTSGSQVIPLSMCDKVWYDTNGKICKSEIVPISDDQVSVDWYKSDNLSMLTNLVGKDNISGKSGKEMKSKPICNVQYIENSADGSDDDVHRGYTNGKFRFSILPKPKYNIPTAQEYFSPFAFKPYTFDGYGNYDRNGWWTVSNPDNYVKIDGYGNVEFISGEKGNLIKHMYPCYNGLTVYEFNFDYVMGMRLFDAKAIAWSLMEAISNTYIGVNVKWERKHQEMAAMAREIIKNVIDSEDDVEIEDCYFTFVNSKYDDLIRRAQEKRARMENFGNGPIPAGDYETVKKIFEEYDENATPEEKKDVIKRVFSHMSATISEGANPEDEDKIGFNFASDILEQLVFVLIQAILSPKVMMLLYVNKDVNMKRQIILY